MYPCMKRALYKCGMVYVCMYVCFVFPPETLFFYLFIIIPVYSLSDEWDCCFEIDNLTLKLLIFWKGIICLPFLELSIIIFRDISIRTWSWSANSIDPGQAGLALYWLQRLITYCSSCIKTIDNFHSEHRRTYNFIQISSFNFNYDNVTWGQS